MSLYLKREVWRGLPRVVGSVGSAKQWQQCKRQNLRPLRYAGFGNVIIYVTGTRNCFYIQLQELSLGLSLSGAHTPSRSGERWLWLWRNGCSGQCSRTTSIYAFQGYLLFILKTYTSIAYQWFSVLLFLCDHTLHSLSVSVSQSNHFFHSFLFCSPLRRADTQLSLSLSLLSFAFRAIFSFFISKFNIHFSSETIILRLD